MRRYSSDANLIKQRRAFSAKDSKVPRCKVSKKLITKFFSPTTSKPPAKVRLERNSIPKVVKLNSTSTKLGELKESDAK